MWQFITTVTEWIFTYSISYFTQKDQRIIKDNRQRLWSRFILETLIFVLLLNEFPNLCSASCSGCPYCYRYPKSVWTNPRLDKLIFHTFLGILWGLADKNNTQTFISYLTGTQPVSVTDTYNLMPYNIVLFLILDSRSGWVANVTLLPLHIQA